MSGRKNHMCVSVVWDLEEFRLFTSRPVLRTESQAASTKSMSFFSDRYQLHASRMMITDPSLSLADQRGPKHQCNAWKSEDPRLVCKTADNWTNLLLRLHTEFFSRKIENESSQNLVKLTLSPWSKMPGSLCLPWFLPSIFLFFKNLLWTICHCAQMHLLSHPTLNPPSLKVWATSHPWLLFHTPSFRIQLVMFPAVIVMHSTDILSKAHPSTNSPVSACPHNPTVSCCGVNPWVLQQPLALQQVVLDGPKQGHEKSSPVAVLMKRGGSYALSQAKWKSAVLCSNFVPCQVSLMSSFQWHPPQPLTLW